MLSGVLPNQEVDLPQLECRFWARVGHLRSLPGERRGWGRDSMQTTHQQVLRMLELRLQIPVILFFDLAHSSDFVLV